MFVTRISPFTKKVLTLDLPVIDEDYTRWKRGVCIQDAFPYLSADEREFMMSGIHPGEWDIFIPEDE
jgi:hypothetical protein